MPQAKEPETESLFLRIPPQLKELLTAAVDRMNNERAPGSPQHTLNSMAVGVLWTFFTAELHERKPTKKAKATK